MISAEHFKIIMSFYMCNGNTGKYSAYCWAAGCVPADQRKRLRSALLSLSEEIAPGSDAENMEISALVDRLRRE